MCGEFLGRKIYLCPVDDRIRLHFEGHIKSVTRERELLQVFTLFYCMEMTLYELKNGWCERCV
jgi:hypothetical protein